MVAHACDSSTQKAEVGVSGIQGHPGLYSKFKVCQGYIARPLFKQTNIPLGTIPAVSELWTSHARGQSKEKQKTEQKRNRS
jgi:hypothetical protein